MHCISTYPCEDSDCNLLNIKVLQSKYGHSVGYSGHERGILPSVLAVALGADAIERHITWDRTAYGSDQSASLEPRGLELLVRDCRDVYKMLGDGLRAVSTKEQGVIDKLRYW
jgi:N-acetylneuraminate synthase